MHKYLMMAALAAVMAVPASASAAPAPFKAEVALYDASADITQPTDDPNALIPLVPAGEQVGGVRYEERSDTGTEIDRQRLRWTATGINLADPNGGDPVEAEDGDQLHTHTWTFNADPMVQAFEDNGPVTDEAGNDLLSEVAGGVAKLDARFDLNGNNGDGIADLDEDTCSVVVVVDDANHNASMLSDELGSC